jgi:hypothetical protein
MSTSNYVRDPFNQILSQKHGLLARAKRFALGTACDPDNSLPLPPSSAQLRNELKFIQINCSSIGDNIIIPATAGVKAVLEMFVWNVGAQNLLFSQGGGANGIPLLALPSFPALTGLSLGFNGNFDMSHFDIDNNQSLILNLSAATQVTGFVRYRVKTGT